MHSSYYVNGTIEVKVEMERVRSKRTTNEQRVALLDYLRTHPELMKGGHISPSARAATWSELAKILNSIDGPKKSADRWLKSFHDWKSDARNKKKALLRNDGAPPLTKNEKELLRLMNELQDDNDGDDDDDDDNSDDPLLAPQPFPSLDIETLKPEPQQFSDSEPNLLDDTDNTEMPRRSSRRLAGLKRKRARESNDDEKEHREERAIRAMEGQAASLERMAAAMERIADVVASAIQATIGSLGPGKDL